MAEVIKVIGKNAFVQVFESTRGMRVGDEAEFEGHMLEVTLGPGMLSRNYDGLQNDLDKMEGVFLRRGEYTFPLDNDKLWDFKPLAKVGDKVAVVENNTITCCGTHEEVLEKNEYYRRAWADYRAARAIAYSVEGGVQHA